MTNAIQQVVTNAITGLDPISAAIRDVSSLGNEGLMAAGLFMLNMVLKRMPSVKNDWIPAITALAGPLFYCSMAGITGRNMVIGFICGSATVHVHQMAKPFLRRFGLPTGDTEQFTKTSNTGTGSGTTGTIATLALCSLLVLTPGCAGSGTGTSIAQAQASVQFASSLGTRMALREKPSLRPYFDAAVTAIDAVLLFQNVTPEQLRATLLALPVKEVRSMEAVAFIEDALRLYRSFWSDAVQRGLDQNAYVRPLLTGFRDGLSQALVQPKKKAKNATSPRTQ